MNTNGNTNTTTAATTTAPASAPKQADAKTTGTAKAGDAKTTDGGKPAADAPKGGKQADPKTTGTAVATTDGGKAAATEAPKPDPFANLPRIKLADTENVLDLTGMETSAARKYQKVHDDAVSGKLPLQRGWKHSTAVFVPGTNKGGENGFKPTSVYGTIASIVQRAGRAGITAQELVTQVRQAQMGANKRSHYCEKLPPVGWAEGWLNSAVTKNVVGVHATKKAPALYVAEKGAEATAEQNAAAKKSAPAKAAAKAEAKEADKAKAA